MNSSEVGLLAFSLIILAVLVLLGVLSVIANWKLFRKAGYDGWISLIPVYNSITLYELCGMSGAWVSLGIITFVVVNFLPDDDSSFLLVKGLVLLLNVPVSMYQGYKLGKVFGKGTGFCIFSALLMPIAAIILAFDNSEWRDPEDLDNME